MNPIRTNKPVFFGDDGEVLKSGQIYIGQPNQWPLSFPKTVTLQDSAGSQFTASQPLKTGTDGRITYNGKSVIALVDGDYSILVRDRNGVTVGEGYTPFVENSDSSGVVADGATQVGLLLSDIKQFNVTPGETVRNVGKATALDGMGADWLVVSSTGSSGDDIDLIDFANGTQGQRINNVLYRKDVDYQREIVLLGGDFISPNNRLIIAKIGDIVTITCPDSFLEHSAGSSVSSSTGDIPSWARPQSIASTLYRYSVPDNYIANVTVTSGGILSIGYADDTISPTTESFAYGVTLTYTI